MDQHAISSDLKPIELQLETICLDPNNPRFVDSSWTYIQEADIPKPDIQESVRRRLVQYFEIEKLQANMEINGYLPVDRVIVRELTNGKYVILEGNRRICAAQLITKVAKDGSAVAADVLASLKNIPCLQYTGSESNAAWIFQGLRHISGIVEWPPYNKARLLVEQMDEDGLSLTEVGRRFGLTPHGAGQWVRGYRAYMQAKGESDYTSELDHRAYTYFQELFSRSSFPMRDWMDWNESSYKFQNMLNLNEFVSWLYPRPSDDDKNGDWEKRLIKTRDHIRQLGELILNAPDLFQQFRQVKDVDNAYSAYVTRKSEAAAKEQADPIDDVFRSVHECTKALDNIPAKVFRIPGTKTRLRDSLSALSEVLKPLLVEASR